MKKLLCVFLALLLIASAAPAAGAEEVAPFRLDERAALTGMKRPLFQGYEPTVSGDKLELILPVRAAEGVSGVAAELTLADESRSPLRPQDMSASVRREGELWALRFSLRLYADRENGDYPCAVHITGLDGQGRALSGDIPYTLRIRDGRENTETARLVLSAPQGELTLGQEGELRLRVQNPCLSLGFEDLSLRFRDPEGEILPQKSDRIQLPDLAPGEETEVAVPVTVLNAAAVRPHSLSFTFEWTALDRSCSQEENLTVPVRQEIRLEQGGVLMANSVVAGDSVTATVDLMNMGKAQVVNTVAALSLPGVVERQSVLVGAIEPGESKQAQISFSVDKDLRGTFEGSLSVQAEDQDGNPAPVLQLPVKLTVQAPAAVPELSGETEKTGPSPAVALLSAACAVLAVLLLVQGTLLRRRLHRMEEERL